MLKNIFPLFVCLTFLSTASSFQVLLAQEGDEENIATGGIAVCKIIGGNEKVTGSFKVTRNSVLLDDFERKLEVELEGNVTSNKGERSLTSEIEVSNVDSNTFKVNKLLKTTASETNLITRLEENDKEFAIIALSQDENRNSLTSEVKLILTSIKKNKVSGITTVNYPRTVTLPLDSPSFVALEEAIKNDTGAEIDLQDANPNGSVILKCKFRDIPLTLIER